jgi:hypothetical protein
MFLEIEDRIVALDAIACIEMRKDGSARVHLKGAEAFAVDLETADQLREYFNPARSEAAKLKRIREWERETGHKNDPEDWGVPTFGLKPIG